MQSVYTCACATTGFSEAGYLKHLDHAHPSKHPWRCLHCHGRLEITDMSFRTHKELQFHRMAYHPDRFDRLKEINEHKEIKFREIPAYISHLLVSERLATGEHPSSAQVNVILEGTNVNEAMESEETVGEHPTIAEVADDVIAADANANRADETNEFLREKPNGNRKNCMSYFNEVEYNGTVEMLQKTTQKIPQKQATVSEEHVEANIENAPYSEQNPTGNGAEQTNQSVKEATQVENRQESIEEKMRSFLCVFDEELSDFEEQDQPSGNGAQEGGELVTLTSEVPHGNVSFDDEVDDSNTDQQLSSSSLVSKPVLPMISMDKIRSSGGNAEKDDSSRQEQQISTTIGSPKESGPSGNLGEAEMSRRTKRFKCKRPQRFLEEQQDFEEQDQPSGNGPQDGGELVTLTSEAPHGNVSFDDEVDDSNTDQQLSSSSLVSKPVIPMISMDKILSSDGNAEKDDSSRQEQLISTTIGSPKESGPPGNLGEAEMSRRTKCFKCKKPQRFLEEQQDFEEQDQPSGNGPQEDGELVTLTSEAPHGNVSFDDEVGDSNTDQQLSSSSLVSKPVIPMISMDKIPSSGGNAEMSRRTKRFKCTRPQRFLEEQQVLEDNSHISQEADEVPHASGIVGPGAVAAQQDSGKVRMGIAGCSKRTRPDVSNEESSDDEMPVAKKGRAAKVAKRKRTTLADDVDYTKLDPKMEKSRLRQVSQLISGRNYVKGIARRKANDPLHCNKDDCRFNEQDPIIHVYHHMRDAKQGPFYCKGCGKLFSVRLRATHHLEKCSKGEPAIRDTRFAFRDEMKALFKECFKNHFVDEPVPSRTDVDGRMFFDVDLEKRQLEDILQAAHH